MKYKKKWIIMTVLFTIAIMIRLVSSNSNNTEWYYSTGIYPYISVAFRQLFGWVPFSIGDILYGLTAAWIVYKIIIDFNMLFHNKFTGLVFLKKNIRYINCVFNNLYKL